MFSMNSRDLIELPYDIYFQLLMRKQKNICLLASVIYIVSLTGCDIMSEKLDEVGRVPQLSKMNMYEEPLYPIHEQIELRSKLSNLGYENGYQYDENTKKKPQNEIRGGSPNSIWKNGSSSFFKAHAIGDILSVIVQISDQAKLDNKTQKARNSGTTVKAPSLMGIENVMDKILPSTSKTSNMINLQSNDAAFGNGKVDRKETVKTTIAVTVIKILTSGNLVIKGTQEVRVNFDVREVTVEGIVRPEDITMDNTVNLEQIAEARVSYGGRGQIFDYQQAPYGKQVLDIISPF